MKSSDHRFLSGYHWPTAFAIHAVVFLSLSRWTWRKWPDPIIDFGRELYTPWQLLQGQLLYRDVASMFGPFSSYFNALCFKLFGPSLTTLILVNLTILALVTWGVYRLIAGCCDRFTAASASLTVLALFGFSQYEYVANTNFVTPYAHEATHGIALALGSLLALLRGVRSASRPWFFASGALFGCILLTKPEASVAMAAAAVVVFLACRAVPAFRDSVRFGRVIFLGASFLPGVLFFAYFAWQMPMNGALRAILGSWRIALTTRAALNPYYAATSGLDQPLPNLLAMATYFGGFMAFCGAGVYLERLRMEVRTRIVYWVATFALCAGVFIVGIAFIPWTLFPKALPLIMCVVLVILGVEWRQTPRDEIALNHIALAGWTTFALVLMAKMMLNARLYHYGFYLALPATTVLLVALLWIIPNQLHRRGLQGLLFRLMSAAMLLAAVAVHLNVTRNVYRYKTLPVGAGADMFYTVDYPGHWEGPAMHRTLAFLETTLPPQATLAVLPEGVMLNFLSKRRNPTPYISLMPPEISAFGEERILAAFKKSPPDYVLLVSRRTDEYGFPQFGVDARFGKVLLDWVHQHYEQTASLADRPTALGGRGIDVLRWRDGNASRPSNIGHRVMTDPTAAIASSATSPR